MRDGHRKQTAPQVVGKVAASAAAGWKCARRARTTGERSYTILELILVIAILGLLASIVATSALPALRKVKLTKTTEDMRALEQMIATYELDAEELPDSLDQVPGASLVLDPWGRPYEYLRIRGGSAPRGRWRKDRFLVPLNSDYDLYSRGPDGLSRPPLTAKHSRDDIVRAGNGAYIGPASEY